MVLFKGAIIFALTFAGLFLISSVSAFEVIPSYEKDIEKIIDEIFDIRCLTANQKKDFNQKIIYHKNAGDQYTNLASNLCWAIPRKTDRDLSIWCWVTFMATLPKGTPLSKLTQGLLAFFCQYGIDCINEWNEIKHYLNWAEYHYGMKEFYENVLVKG
jgi:hypothetical protein